MNIRTFMVGIVVIGSMPLQAAPKRKKVIKPAVHSVQSGNAATKTATPSTSPSRSASQVTPAKKQVKPAQVRYVERVVIKRPFYQTIVLGIKAAVAVAAGILAGKWFFKQVAQQTPEQRRAQAEKRIDNEIAYRRTEPARIIQEHMILSAAGATPEQRRRVRAYQASRQQRHDRAVANAAIESRMTDAQLRARIRCQATGAGLATGIMTSAVALAVMNN